MLHLLSEKQKLLLDALAHPTYHHLINTAGDIFSLVTHHLLSDDKNNMAVFQEISKLILIPPAMKSGLL